MRYIINIICLCLLVILTGCNNSKEDTPVQEQTVYVDYIIKTQELQLKESNGYQGFVQLSIDNTKMDAPDSLVLNIVPSNNKILLNGQSSVTVTVDKPTAAESIQPVNIKVTYNGDVLDSSLNSLCYGLEFYIEYNIVNSTNTSEKIYRSTGAVVSRNADIFIEDDPFKNSPLTALAHIVTNEKAVSGFKIKYKNNPSVVDAEKTYTGYDTKQDAAIYGLYENHDNIVELFAYKENGEKCFSQEFILKRNALNLTDYAGNLDTYKITVEKADYEHITPGWLLFLLRDKYRIYNHKIMVDMEGNIRWFLDENVYYAPIELDKDNDIMMLTHESNPSIAKYYSLLGQEKHDKLIDITDAGYKFHHDMITKDNGNIIAAVSKNGAKYVEDRIIEYNPATKQVIYEWDLNKVIPKRSAVINWYKGYPTDWLHINSVYYNKPDNTVIFSARHQGIYKITYPDENGNFSVVWAVTPHIDLDGYEVDIKDKLLKPVDKNGILIEDEDVLAGRKSHADFEWPFAQHSVRLTSENSFVCFDNGDNRYYEGEVTHNNSFSRIVEYEINETNMTIKEKWSYGKDRGLDLFSQFQSNAYMLESGNYIVHSGMVRYNSDESRMRVVELNKDHIPVFEMSVQYGPATSSYRAYKVNLFDYLRIK